MKDGVEQHLAAHDRALGRRSVRARATARARQATRPEGAQIKVNLLLRRLPRLREAGVDPAAAFGGTFHVQRGLERSSRPRTTPRSRDGSPTRSPSRATVTRSPTPASSRPNCASRARRRSPSSGCRRPIGSSRPARRTPGGPSSRRRCCARSTPCSPSRSPTCCSPTPTAARASRPRRRAISSRELRMPGGNIFHGPLDWPFAEDDAELGDSGRALGRRDRARAHPAVRRRSAPRRGGERDRRPQRGNGGARSPH